MVWFSSGRAPCRAANSLNARFIAIQAAGSSSDQFTMSSVKISSSGQNESRAASSFRMKYTSVGRAGRKPCSLWKRSQNRR